VEAAILLPLFIALLIGILEGGRMLMLNQTMRVATSTSARAAAIAGNDISADYRILSAIEGSTTARIPADHLDLIVVFKATSSTASVPSGCLSASIPNQCNRYTGADLDLLEADLASCVVPSKARFWCPSTRKYAATDADGNGPPDWIGVYIEADMPMVTKLFGSSITLTDTQITRIEATAIS
jgi:hypothetical protein